MKWLWAPAAIFVTACADGGDSAPTNAFVPVEDACALVTADDLAEQFDVRFDPPEKMFFDGGEGGGANATCSYTSSDEGEVASIADINAMTARTIYVNVTVMSWPGDDTAKEVFPSMVAPVYEGASFEPVAGYGDEAQRDLSGQQGVVIREGGAILVVSLSQKTMPADERAEKELALARTALDRL